MSSGFESMFQRLLNGKKEFKTSARVRATKRRYDARQRAKKKK